MRALAIFLMLVLSFSLKASHIVGGDICYDYLGNNNYQFFITIYRDCASGGAQYDDPLVLAVYPQGSSSALQTISIPFPGSVILPIGFNKPCGIAPMGLCVERAIYTTIINLPPTTGGYDITYQRCCRGQAITNLVSPDNTGLTLNAHVPGFETGAFANSSPRFNTYPPLLLCNNDQLVFDHSATDPDGDIIVYSLVAPYAGGDAVNPLPNPPPPPPYYPVTWGNGFSSTLPLGPGSNTIINSSSGLLSCTPQMLGVFVVGIRVQEYRNGVLIGQTVRDFLFKVLNCNLSLSAILPTQEELSTFESYCQGLTVNFENNSYGGSVYQWDFGVNGTATDVSNQFEPSYTYPAPGTYNATLVINPGEPCTDTAHMIVTVNNEFSVSFQTIDSVCIEGNNLNFYSQTTGASAETFSWNFGPNASVNSATTENVIGVTFNTFGSIPVTIEAQTDYCSASYTDNIIIFPKPVAVIDLPVGYECGGLTVTFGNSSTDITNSAWDFGVSGSTADTSSLQEPTFTFPQGGTYEITLIASSTGSCVDTVTASITVNEPLTLSFTNNDSLCLTGNSFWFDGTMTGPNSTQIKWDFGENATPPTSSNLDVNDVVFNTSGLHTVTLTAWFGNCYEQVTDQIFIFRVPTIDFTDIPGPRCAPATVQFQNLSQADSEMSITWTFGDGAISANTNPTHVYTDVGSYSVGLKVMTSDGCIDTLYILKQDLVTIHPSPISKFSVDKKFTDICNAQIQFIDESEGASQYFYLFDDSTFFSEEKNPVHIYRTGGTLYPMQIATNEYGCDDTSYQKLIIEPFSIYFPNSFTPDGNEFNNQFNGIFGLEVNAWELSIYNKWGEMVYQTDDPQFGWDGSSKGKNAQEGTYTFILRYVSCDKPDGWQSITGHVNLLK